MKDKSDDKKSISEKVKTKSEKGSDPKSEKESTDKNKNNSILKSISDKNGMLCPKSVRNQMKKTKDNSDKSDVKSEDGIKIKSKEDLNSNLLIKKPISNISEIKTVEIIKINNEKINLSVDFIKSTKCKPSLIYSSNPVLNEINHNTDESDQTTKHKKKKKHGKSKTMNDSDDGNKDLKNKKSRKSKKKKHKEMSPEDVFVKIEPNTDNITKEAVIIDSKVTKAPMSLLVSYSSDEEDSHVEPPSIPIIIKAPSEIKSEQLVNNEENFDKIEIKIKPTKSPGKSAWDSTDSELENESKEIINVKAKSRSATVASKHSKKSKSSTSKEKSVSKSCSKSRSESRSKSGSHSRSRSHSRTSKSHSGSSESHSRSYSRSHSRSYSESSDSRSRSYSRSRSRSRRKSRHHRHHSSSYSRSRSRYRSRSVSRSSSDSRSSRSYSRSRSRYKSGYSNRYRSRSRTRSSRSRSRNSYYRSSYRKHKRSSSPDNFLNPQSRKNKIFNRNTLLGAAPKPVDISKKIDAIKESQKKAAEAHNLSNLNIPLPPEKPKTTPVKPSPGEWCPSMDFGGPVAKKAKKALGNKSNTDSKAGELNDTMNASENNLLDSNYIGPQVSSDMAKKLGLDVKAGRREKDNNNSKRSAENSLNESYLSTALDPSHLALQSRAYQHRLNNLQGNSNSEYGGQTAQYFHPLYMSPSSLTNNLTATALAAVASEQLPASVAGSIAQAAVQRIMSSSNLTATYNTPSVVATPTASYQTALQHTIPGSCSTLVASTPSGLVPISLLQQGGMQYGINQLVFQHLQQQALGAQFGQTIAIPNQSILGGINPLLLQASNQQALLQSLGFGAQTQLLTSPLNFQHTLLMAAQQQQQQMLAAAQLNQAATIQAAQLQAQIQAQARAVSIQSLQQAAQMQSSAQNAAAASMAHAMDQQLLEQVAKSEAEYHHHQLPVAVSSGGEETKPIICDYQISLEHAPSAMETNLITSSTTDSNHSFDESAVNTTVTTEPSQEANFITETEVDLISNEISSSSVIKQQAPRIIYNSPAVMASLVTSPVTKP